LLWSKDEVIGLLQPDALGKAKAMDRLWQRQSTIEDDAACAGKLEHRLRQFLIRASVKWVRLVASSSRNPFAIYSHLVCSQDPRSSPKQVNARLEPGLVINHAGSEWFVANGEIFLGWIG
jgi:hypothetical protein